MKKDLKERDAMVCRACGNQERASEGYPCTNCGTFLCIICTFRGVTLCKKCADEGALAPPSQMTTPRIDWPEH
jgi:hypothetical protein